MFCGGCLRLTADESWVGKWEICRPWKNVEGTLGQPMPHLEVTVIYQPISTWSTHRVALMKNCDPPELACPVFAIDRVPAELLSSDMNSSWGLGDLKEMLQKALISLTSIHWIYLTHKPLQNHGIRCNTHLKGRASKITSPLPETKSG